MVYSEKMPIFTAKHPAQTVTVDGAAYRYMCAAARAAIKRWCC